MISFRLTADEYDRFHELCAACGTRSVSELARAAINALLKQPAHASSDSIESRVAELEGRVNSLRSELMKIRRQDASQVVDVARPDSTEQRLTEPAVFEIRRSPEPEVIR
jgi:Ribbon-helix-helix protein, copG family